MSTFLSARAMQRRSFFRVAGATLATSTLVLAGCKDDEEPVTPVASNVLRLGVVTSASGAETVTQESQENGVLNYAYLLEQLEAAFYTQVVAAPPADLLSDELAYLTDLRDHELIHREYLKAALGASVYDASLSTPLKFNFSSFTLTTRVGVWTAAQQLEDIGVAAYNGAGKLLTVTTNLLALGKIASVEARHAALVHEVLQSDSFASTIGADGLDDAKTPTEVIELIKTLLPIEVSVAALPTA
ncbi:ferritin-like domain-containing protein [Hymenobacter volaticus]|uniref:Ferritin-like domain-containing protein n=1 Tax=Hymenobacter volaticus TaxID=2932254 RepID=A0ABY4G3R9_9BACT|nr:ferritin-like domain-containing protein [Hymenobacter volaticus]UOQ65530.1 ferritin-like domain-containing protein [Hymenobacter volaticus]